MRGAYYNEIDPYCVEWLRNLISAGLIPAGDVDSRSIEEVQPDDLAGYAQCHFFAGLGGWAYAARLAGWPDDRPIWTGSCPCQPFSVANVKSLGSADKRHLLPRFARLIVQGKPPVVFGEQVPRAIEWGWLDELCDGLAAAEYAVWPIVLAARDAGADHLRKRLYWVADSDRARREGHKQGRGISGGTKATLPHDSDPLVRARMLLAGDYSGLLLDDGVSVAVERCATKGYGNAIVPELAAEVIRAWMETVAWN